MKRIICLCLCLTLFVFAAACKEKEPQVKHDIDISYFAELGSLPESEIKIGDAVPEENAQEGEFFFTKDGARSYFSNGDFCYYYNADEKEPKVYGIAAFSSALGFEVGAISIEITDVLDAQEVKYVAGTPASGELFFLPQGENREVISVKETKHTLTFVFEDNALCAVYLGEYEYAANSN